VFRVFGGILWKNGGTAEEKVEGISEEGV